jgi:tellurite resistance protein
MFLSSLSRKEKTLFSDLAIAIVQLDGVVSEHETSVLAMYSKETKTAFDVNKTVVDIEKTIADFLKRSTPQVLRGVLSELVALAKVDGSYSTLELDFIEHVAESWNYDKSVVQKIIDLQEEYARACSAIIMFVNRGE